MSLGVSRERISILPAISGQCLEFKGLGLDIGEKRSPAAEFWLSVSILPAISGQCLEFLNFKWL